MTRHASLPMYDLPEIRGETAAWWRGLAGYLRRNGVGDVPDDLGKTSGDPYVHWLSPDLLFSQTCGYPLVTRLAGRVRVVATPCYDAPGCHGAGYCSLIVIAEGAEVQDYAGLAGGVLAVNAPDSHSGYNVIRRMSGGIGHFAAFTDSGSHRNNIRMVAERKADAAAVDTVTHALLAMHAPEALAGTRILCQSPAAPGLPYVTAMATPPETVERLRAGLMEALADPSLKDLRRALLLKGAEVLPEGAYEDEIEK